MRRQRDIDAAVRQVIGGAVDADEVIDLFAVAGLEEARLDILSDEFLGRVAALEQKNLALETLRKLLNDQIRITERTNLVQSKKFREALEDAMLRYTNKAITTAEMIARLIDLAKHLRDAQKHGEELGLSSEETAFYDALAENESAREAMQSDTLRLMARELTEMVKKMPKLDWTQRESVRASLRRNVRRLLAKYGYPPDLAEGATQLVLRQAELSTELGYRNVTGPDGQARSSPSIPRSRRSSPSCSSGTRPASIALKEVAKKARAAGLVYKKSGAPVPTSTVHSILRNRLYTGWFEWNGKLYQGKHEPLVSVEAWERVQGVMDGRNASKHRRMTHDFAFSGLIACARCGCSVVGEIKKQKYIYYHCTGYADKCRGEPASCRRKYVREEVLEQQFTAMLGQLRFDDEVLEWVREALHASHADERHEHEEAIKRLQAEHRRLGERISAMYVDKLDGKIGGDFFDKMAGEWREEQRRLQRDIDRHEEAEQSYMDEGMRILELARNAQALFERQPAREKRRLLNFVLSNCSWEDGEVVATFRQPFDLLAETTAIAARSSAGNSGNSSKNEIWLGD
jgi:hypothetical protein